MGIEAHFNGIKDKWSLCGHCGGCYYHGPLVPHNWLELPPDVWASPERRCPSFEFYKFRAYTPLGRGLLAALAFRNRIDLDNELAQIVYTCFGCGMCSEVCVLDPLSAVQALKRELARKRGIRPQQLEKAEERVVKCKNLFPKRKRIYAEGFERNQGNTLFFAGCVLRTFEAERIREAAQLFNFIGHRAIFLDTEEPCCGFILLQNGNTKAFEQYARGVYDLFREMSIKRIVVTCAHCYKTLAFDYPLVFGPLGFTVMHISQFIYEFVRKELMKIVNPIELVVTYHDPCFLGRHSGIYDLPREVIRDMSVELIEMPRSKRWAYCCGAGAKGVMLAYPELSRVISRERLEEAKRTADVLVTACSTCFFVLRRTAKNGKIKIYDFASFILERLRETTHKEGGAT